MAKTRPMHRTLPVGGRLVRLGGAGVKAVVWGEVHSGDGLGGWVT